MKGTTGYIGAGVKKWYSTIQYFFSAKLEWFFSALYLEIEMERGKEQQQIQELVTFLSTMDDVGVTDREMTLRENGVWNYQGGCHKRGTCFNRIQFWVSQKQMSEVLYFVFRFLLFLFLYYDQQMHNYFTNNLWNNCAFVGHSTKYTCVTWQGIDYKLSEDDTIVSKHVAVW